MRKDHGRVAQGPYGHGSRVDNASCITMHHYARAHRMSNQAYVVVIGDHSTVKIPILMALLGALEIVVTWRAIPSVVGLAAICDDLLHPPLLALLRHVHDDVVLLVVACGYTLGDVVPLCLQDVHQVEGEGSLVQSPSQTAGTALLLSACLTILGLVSVNQAFVLHVASSEHVAPYCSTSCDASASRPTLYLIAAHHEHVWEATRVHSKKGADTNYIRIDQIKLLPMGN